MISVIIPLYNQAQHLPRTLDSLLAQNYKDFEVIVVNDGSSDNGQAAAESFSGRFLKLGINYKVIKHEKNLGAPAARNRGFKEARGAYLLFCDADVRLNKEMLAAMLNALESHPEAAFAYSSFKWGRKLFRLFPYDAARLKNFPYINMMSLMRREDFPGFDRSLKKFQDWDLWLTMAEQGSKGVWLNECLYRIEPRKAGISRWLPKFMYKIPWRRLGFEPEEIRKYREAEETIRKKHYL